MNGINLLNQFRERRSESAFSELVRLYTNLVYSVAIRRLGNQSLAQEAAQTAFIRLAKAPPPLHSDAELAAWLHRTAVHVSIDLWRAEVRRRAREEQAAVMQLNSNEDLSWKEIAPALDEALNDLNDSDRQAILLRFFEEKPMRIVGTVFGISEDAAKMRVSRALDRLRQQLRTRGVTCSSLALGALLAKHSVEASPAAVAAALAIAPYPVAESAASMAGSSAGFVAGLGLGKLAGGIVALMLVGVVTWLLIARSDNGVPVAATLSATVGSNRSVMAEATATGAPQVSASATAIRPDPVKLLQAVARARQRIASGSVEFQVDTAHFPEPDTNRVRLTALFDGIKCRFEQFGREYAYTYDPPRAQEIETKARAFGSDKEGAVQAGWLTGFEAHSVSVHDGANLMRYREKDEKPEGTTIEDSSKGSYSHLFDPRCLGLSASLSPSSTIDGCLAIASAQTVELAEEEPVNGVACWHLRVPSWQSEFWIAVAWPTQVLKVRSGAAVAISRYDPSNPNNPLPVEVTSTHYRDGTPTFETHFLRLASQFNLNIDPSTFTLAGLNMKAGTPVSDSRIMRRIGYWTGAGLSDDLPPKTLPVPDEQPKLEELLAILDNDPASAAALDAATWILLNTPDGPAVDQAAAVVRHDHVRSPELASLCQQMERLRHRCTQELLEAVLNLNPDPEVRATACFTLATLRKDACAYGLNQKVTAEAEKLFERVINDFAQVGRTGAELARKAKSELSELRRLTIGKPAPEIEGVDLQGQPIKLSEQRGKVVVLVFWSASTVDGPEEHQQLLARFAGRPWTWIGINCDHDSGRATAAFEKHGITWPSIWDGRSGPISRDWNVQSWPTVFVLDRNGVIRSRAARGLALTEAVAALLP